MKPLLTATNKATRMAWCTAHIDPTSLLFHDMFNYIHVDEKLFYLTEVKRRFYLLPGEAVPHRQVRSKRHQGNDASGSRAPSIGPDDRSRI